MTGNSRPAEDPEVGQEPARIVLEFGPAGSADCVIQFKGGVTPGQVYAGAWLLDAGARELRQGQLMSAAMNGLTKVPSMPAGLDELIRKMA